MPVIGLAVVLAVSLLAPLAAGAQQPTKIPKLGYLTNDSVSVDLPRRNAFREGLRDLGYIEGQSIVIEYRVGEGKTEKLNRSEKHQNFSESGPAGQVRGKCRITSCQFISFSCTDDLPPERFFRVNIRSESERAALAASWRP